MGDYFSNNNDELLESVWCQTHHASAQELYGNHISFLGLKHSIGFQGNSKILKGILEYFECFGTLSPIVPTTPPISRENLHQAHIRYLSCHYKAIIM